MIKRMLIMLLAVSVVLGGVFGFIDFKKKMIKQFMTAQGEPVQTVATLLASYQQWQPKLKAMGSVQAVQGVELSTEVSGMVTSIHFQQGAYVPVNAPILQLRAEHEIAHLHALEAAVNLARITFQRSEGQFKARAISQQVLDMDRITLDIARANLAEQQALVEKKTLRAPFSGNLGIRAVNVGQFLNAGSSVATLQNLDKVYVDFYLPQQALVSLTLGQAIELSCDTYPTQLFTGKITVINPKIEVATRNILVRAMLDNTKHQLLPGMYVTVNVFVGALQQHITLPHSAISFNPFGSTVYIVKQQTQDKLTVEQAFVTTGASRGDQIAILTGVKEGDQVVTAGQIKLHNGSSVRIDNSVQPSTEAYPQPVDK